MEVLQEVEEVQKALKAQGALLSQVRSQHNAMTNRLSKLKRRIKATQRAKQPKPEDPAQLNLFT